MSTSKKSPSRFRVGDWVSFDYGLRRVTAQVMEDRGGVGVRGRRLYRVRPRLDQGESADFEIPEEELEVAAEPRVGSSPRVFDVIYIREGNTKTWAATTKRTTGYGAVAARGAVGYTTARWEGESNEEKFALVSVIVEGPPQAGRQFLLEEVRRLADEMFKQKHPEAVIRHEDYESSS